MGLTYNNPEGDPYGPVKLPVELKTQFKEDSDMSPEERSVHSARMTSDPLYNKAYSNWLLEKNHRYGPPQP